MRRVIGMLGSAGLMAGLVTSLSGCVETVIGGVATVGVAATEERGVSGALTDARIRTDINAAWLHASMDMLQKVDLSVNEGRVHLTGTVPTPEMRLQAVKLVWQVEGVRQVLDDIDVGQDRTTAGSYARDVWISTQLRSDLLFDRAVDSVNYSVETVEGTVYLMGVAQNQAELDRVTNYARNIGSVKRVVSYVRMKDQPLPRATGGTTQAGGPPPGGAVVAPSSAAPPPPVPPVPVGNMPERAPVETEPLSSPPSGPTTRNPS
jgi:osmotically-inducible protein OsmY